MKKHIYYIKKIIKNNTKINIYKTDKNHIKKLKKKYKKENKTTDILSFTSKNKLDNDIYIYNTETYKKKISKLIIHGTLHILDYTHNKKNDSQIMLALEKIIGMSGIEPPTITTSK